MGYVVITEVAELARTIEDRRYWEARRRSYRWRWLARFMAGPEHGIIKVDGAWYAFHRRIERAPPPLPAREVAGDDGR